MRTAVVTLAPDGSPPYGFALSLAQCVTRSGYDCSLIWVSAKDTVANAKNSDAGVNVVYLKPAPAAVRRFPDFPLFHLSHQIAPLLTQFDIVYSLVLGHPAMQAVRLRRFSPSRAPFFVTIIEQTYELSLTGQRRFSADPAEWNQIFGERYQVRHSDRVICLEPFDARELRERSWDVPGDPRSMSRNPEEWVRFHREVEAAARSALSAPKPRVATADPAVTVCMPYFNHGRYVADALAGMARQTSRRFTLMVVDDGSTSADSQRAFEDMRELYRERGWRFLSRPRAGAGTVRNFAARQAESEYLLFFDTDDIPPPNLVERLLEAAEYSDDDLLTVWHYKFHDVEKPYDFKEHRMLVPPHLFYTPAGADPLGNLVRNLLGGGVCLLRRNALLAVGGFPEQWGGSEDYALYMRMVRAGYAVDVVPEVLCYNRDTPGSVSKTLSRFSNQEFIRRVIDQRLNSIGLSQFALTFRALVEDSRTSDRN